MKHPITGAPNPPTEPPGAFPCGSMLILAGALASSSHLRVQPTTQQQCAGTFLPDSDGEPDGALAGIDMPPQGKPGVECPVGGE